MNIHQFDRFTCESFLDNLVLNLSTAYTNFGTNFNNLQNGYHCFLHKERDKLSDSLKYRNYVYQIDDNYAFIKDYMKIEELSDQSQKNQETGNKNKNDVKTNETKQELINPLKKLIKNGNDIINFLVYKNYFIIQIIFFLQSMKDIKSKKKQEFDIECCNFSDFLSILKVKMEKYIKGFLNDNNFNEIKSIILILETDNNPNNESKKIENLKKILNKFTFYNIDNDNDNDNNTNLIFNQLNNLFDISKNPSIINKANFMEKIKSIFTFYKEYFEYDPTKIFLLDFADFLIENNIFVIDNQSFDEDQLFEDVFKRIQNERNKFFSFDFASKMMIERLLDQQNLQKNSKLLNNESLNNYKFECKQFNSESYTAKLYIDSQINFFLHIEYPDDANPDAIKFEKAILEGNYSKYVVHFYSNDERLIPYYPLGTLNSVISQKVKLSFVDRFVISLQIAIGLSDLHEKGRFHGNLSNDCIFLDSSKSAYIGGFSYDIYRVNTINKHHYDSPEMLEFKENKENTFNNKESYIQAMKNSDIFSFGVLLYEIFTGISPKTLFENENEKNKNLSFVKNTIKNNYFGFLFEQGDMKNRIDYFIDYRGDSSKGIKLIIEKCMTNNPVEHFSSMNEIIESLKNLPIYEQNHDEIEFKINKSNDSHAYKCSFSDLVIGYYLGQKDNLEIIKYSINGSKNQIKSEVDQFNSKDDIINYILQFFKIKYSKSNEVIQNQNKDILYLLNLSNNDPYEIKSYPSFFVYQKINRIYDFYSHYILPSKKAIYSNFIDVLIDKEFLIENDALDNSLPFKEIESRFKQLINQILTNNKSKEISPKYFLFKIFVEYLFHVLLNQETFKKEFFNKINAEDYESGQKEQKNLYIELSDALSYSEKSFSSRVYLDSNFNYVLIISYMNDINKSVIDREKYIYNKDFNSKFIIHSMNDNNQLVIPYFPLGTINFIIDSQNQMSNTRLKLNLVEKIAIILEIADGLKGLHEEGYYHGNLCGQSIYLNSSKDAYIGYFSYDRSLEPQGSKSKGPIYTRAPEIAKKFNEEAPSDGSKDAFIERQKLGDIYSYGVLMHEILTDSIPEKRFGSKPRDQKIAIVEGEKYNEFLFGGKNNEIFDNEEYGKSLKDIILKCMKFTPGDRYKSMSDIIDDIQKSPLYIKYKEQIDYKIKTALNSKEYKCNFYDIVECFYEGQTRLKTTIEKTLQKYDEDFKLSHDMEIITQIFECINIQREDNTYICKDFFNYIIVKSINSEIDENYIVDLSNQLLRVSINANSYSYKKALEYNTLIDDDYNVVQPVSTLKYFLENNKNTKNSFIIKHYLIWFYLIAKELMEIHSNNLFHGELSMNTIGIYYNNKINFFVPSIILFYYLYKGSKNDSRIIINHIDNYYIEKMQKKDIKRFIKIIYSFQILKESHIEKLNLNDNSSIGMICNNLYSLCLEEDSKFFQSCIRFTDYQYFVITYTDLFDILAISKANGIKFLSIDFENILDNFIKYIESSYNNFDYPIDLLIPKIKSKNKLINSNIEINFNIIQNLHDTMIVEMLKLSHLIFERLPKIYIPKNIIIEKDGKLMINLSEKPKPVKKKIERQKFTTIKKKIEKQERNWFKKTNIRRFELSELTLQSVTFLVKRYLFNLNPNLRFKVTIKILNKVYSPYQNVPIKAQDIIDLSKKIGFPNAVIEDGNVVITIIPNKNEENEAK